MRRSRRLLLTLGFCAAGLVACRPSVIRINEGGRIAVLAGGSGEPEANNFFNHDFRGLRERLMARGWKVRAALGARDRILPGSVMATNFDIRAVIESGVRDARKGDELLILLHSHGREREKLWAQRSHSLVSEDRDPSGSDPGFNLDSIEPLLQEAHDRGVRVALVDLSCYSGSTLALKGPDCGVTLAAPDYISICSGRPEERAFNSRFFDLPSPDTPADLSSQFLKARREDRESVNLPQISTRPTVALELWNDLLAGLDPLDVNGDLAAYRNGAKPYSATHFLKGMETALGKLKLTATERSGLMHGLRGELEGMVRLRAQLEQAMPEMARSYDQDSLKIRLPGPASQPALAMSPGNLVDFLDKISEERFDPNRLDGYSQAHRDLMSRLRPDRMRLAQEHAAAISAFRKRKEQYDEKVEELATAAGRLFALERQIYGAQTPDEAPDPCRDFHL